MLKTIQYFCDEPSAWSVTLTNQGQSEFKEIAGNSQLLYWCFLIQVPEQKGRTQRELCEQVRRAAVEEIARQCRKDGLSASLDELTLLETHDMLDCVYREEVYFR
jgi:hypothetical protein